MMFGEKELLLVPGPTPIPPFVERAMLRPMINHRGPAYEQFFASLLEKLKRLFEVDGDIFVFPGSGTGALEALVVNFLSPGDRVLMITTGFFGDRWGEIAERFGAQVTWLRIGWGEAATREKVADALSSPPHPFKAVLITMNETSTGVVNPIEEIAPIVKEAGCLLLVDAVSGLAAMPLPMKEWRIDAVAAASQKALMTPPGVALVAVSEWAWDAVEKAQMPRYYWDFRSAREFQRRHQNPYTPTLSLLFGLDAALTAIFNEGLERVFLRHRHLRDLLREGSQALGLEPLVADPKYASCSLTAVKVPPSLSASSLVDLLRRQFRVEVAGGQEHLRGKIIRISHMGWVDESDIFFVLSALERGMKELRTGR